MVTNIFAQYTNMNISARNTPNWIFLHEEKKIKQQCSFDKISATTILEVIVGPFSAAPLRLSSHQYGGGNKSIVLNNWTLPFYKISATTIPYHTPWFATMLLSSVPELQHFRTHKLMVTLICLSVQFQSDSSWKPILRQDRWASQVWSTSQVCFCIVFTIQDFNICLSRAAWHRKRPDQHFLQESCASKCLFADTQCLHSWQSGNLTNLDVLHLPFQPAILNAIILQEEDALLTNMKLPYHLWCILWLGS